MAGTVSRCSIPAAQEIVRAAENDPAPARATVQAAVTGRAQAPAIGPVAESVPVPARVIARAGASRPNGRPNGRVAVAVLNTGHSSATLRSVAAEEVQDKRRASTPAAAIRATAAVEAAAVTPAVADVVVAADVAVVAAGGPT